MKSLKIILGVMIVFPFVLSFAGKIYLNETAMEYANDTKVLCAGSFCVGWLIFILGKTKGISMAKIFIMAGMIGGLYGCMLMIFWHL